MARMSITAEQVAEVLALPEQDRAFLVRQHIANLDNTVDEGAEASQAWSSAVLLRRQFEKSAPN